MPQNRWQKKRYPRSTYIKYSQLLPLIEKTTEKETTKKNIDCIKTQHKRLGKFGELRYKINGYHQKVCRPDP